MKKTFLPVKPLVLAVLVTVFANSNAFAIHKPPMYSPVYSCGTVEKEEKPTVEVTKIEEIELPIRKKDYGEYYDDFDRRVADDIRKEAKVIYEEQQKNLEKKELEERQKTFISKIEDITLPVHKNTYYDERYVYYYGNQGNITDPIFYDDLGRPISRELDFQVHKIYQKQQKKRDLSFNCGYFWRTFFSFLEGVIFLILVIFGISFLIKKCKSK